MVFQLNRLFDTVRTGVSGWINKTLVEPFEAAVAKHKDKIEHDSGTTAALTQHKNPSLVDQLYSPQAAQVQAALSRILALVIVPDPRVTQAMVEHGVGIAVVRAMKNHPIDLAVQTLACKLLANLVYDHHPTANLIVEQGGVPLFVHAMRKFARDQTILRRSGSAMNNVLVVSTRDGNGPVVKKTAADVGAIPTFVAILKDHSNNLDTFSIACKCLESLTDANPSNVHAAVLLNVVPILSRVIAASQSGNHNVLEQDAVHLMPRFIEHEQLLGTGSASPTTTTARGRGRSHRRSVSG